jgi:hypothetical protein
MAIFANLKYVEVGFKFVKMAQHFSCSPFSCISKDAPEFFEIIFEKWGPLMSVFPL